MQAHVSITTAHTRTRTRIRTKAWVVYLPSISRTPARHYSLNKKCTSFEKTQTYNNRNNNKYHYHITDGQIGYWCWLLATSTKRFNYENAFKRAICVKIYMILLVFFIFCTLLDPYELYECTYICIYLCICCQQFRFHMIMRNIFQSYFEHSLHFSFWFYFLYVVYIYFGFLYLLFCCNFPLRSSFWILHIFLSGTFGLLERIPICLWYLWQIFINRMPSQAFNAIHRRHFLRPFFRMRRISFFMRRSLRHLSVWAFFKLSIARQ